MKTNLGILNKEYRLCLHFYTHVLNRALFTKSDSVEVCKVEENLLININGAIDFLFKLK